MSLGSYYSNYLMTNAVQKTVQDMRNDLSHKINHIPVSYFDRHQFGDLLGRFTSDVETVLECLATVPSYKSLMLSLPCSLSSAWSCT